MTKISGIAQRRLRLSLPAAVAVSVVALLSSCAGDSQATSAVDLTPTATADAGTPTATAVPTLTATSTATSVLAPPTVTVSDPGLHMASEADSLLVTLLEAVPDTPAIRASVKFDNYLAVRRQLEIDLPGPAADSDAWFDYMLAMAGADTTFRPGFLAAGDNWLFGIHEYTEGSNTLSSLAMDQRNADQGIIAGEGQQALEITFGRFDPQATADALAACGECAQHDLVDHAGATFYAWGEDFEQDLQRRLTPPMFDQFGRGGRLWVTDFMVARALYTAGIESVIDAVLGASATLANDPDFVMAARALDGLGAHTAVLSTSTFDTEQAVEAIAGGGGDADKARDAILAAPLLRPFTLAAVGSGFDPDGTRFTAVVLVHESDTLAQENVDLLTTRVEEGVIAVGFWPGGESDLESQPWAAAIQRMEISSDGRVLLAKLYGSITPYGLVSPPGALSNTSVPNSLLVHE